MTVEETIKKAIEGGWTPQGYDPIIRAPINASVKGDEIVLQGKGQEDGWGGWQGSIKLSEWNYERTFLDPLFWQSLGKAMDYSEEGWLREWHRFIDHLAHGKSTEEFFKNLEN